MAVPGQLVVGRTGKNPFDAADPIVAISGVLLRVGYPQVDGDRDRTIGAGVEQNVERGVEDVLDFLIAVNQVIPRVQADRVGSVAPLDLVAATAAIQRIVAELAKERILSGVASQAVVVIAA